MSDEQRPVELIEGTTPGDRRVLLANGYEPIPICGKGPRWPWRCGLISDALLTSIESDPVFADHTNTGLRTGRLAGIDIDVSAPEHVELVKQVIFKELGRSYLERIGSKGALLCYFNPDPIPKLTVSGKPPGDVQDRRLVEILGDGQQVAAYGVHPGTGKPYRWVNAVDDEEPLCRKLTDLPEVTPGQLRNVARKIGEVLTAAGFSDVSVSGIESGPVMPTIPSGEPVSLSWVRDALQVIPPDIARQEWLGILWAVKETHLFPDTDDAGRLELLDRWSSGALAGKECASYRGYDDVADSYSWAKGNVARPVTIGSLALVAHRHDFQGGPPRVRLMELANDNFWPEDTAEDVASNRWAKLIRQGQAIFEMPPAGMVVPGWLRDRGFTGILAGRGTGKTVVAVGLCLSIASEKRWMGEPVASGYYVVYLCGEDQENTAAHIEAWCRKYNGGRVPPRFVFFEDVPDLLNPADCDKLTAHLKTIIPEGSNAVIVADTWQRATSAAKDGQNSDRDMAAAAASLEAIAKAFNGLAIACFHPPKGERQTNAPSIHGSAIIENTSTGIWTLATDDGGLKLEVTRIKGPGLGNFKRVRLESAGLGRSDAFGSELTGNVAVHEGGVMSGLASRAEREDSERQCVLEATYALIDQGIGLVKTNGGGQKPADVAVMLKQRYGMVLDKRKVLEHLNTLQRQGHLEYVDSNRNSRVKAGFRRPTNTHVEKAAEIVPKAIPNADEDI